MIRKKQLRKELDNAEKQIKLCKQSIVRYRVEIEDLHNQLTVMGKDKDSDKGWYRSDQQRVKTEESLVSAMRHDDMSVFGRHYRTESMWVRKWAQYEWRAD